MVPLEILHNSRVHISELAAVAFVKNNDNVLVIDHVPFVLRHKGGELLNGGDDNSCVRVLQLLFQNGGRGVGVGRPLFKAVILLHGLVVQVFPVHHEQHLIYVRQQRGQTGSFEAGEGFAGTGGVPDVPAASDGAVFLIIVCNFNPVQNPLGGGDLIGPHHHEHLVRGKNTIPGQDIQQGMLGKKCPGKVHQVRQEPVVGVGPKGRELKAVAGLFLLGRGGRSGVLDGVAAGAVGVVLGVRTIGDRKNLHILI